MLSPCGDLHGLTRRELEVLGLLIAGWHDVPAARLLGVSPHTVATHVEHVLSKLYADTRALAAVRAQRRGLDIPPALLVATRRTISSRAPTTRGRGRRTETGRWTG